MKYLIIFLVTFSIITAFSIPAFADTVTVKPAQGSGAPGCEISRVCYSPDPAVIKIGDRVMWVNTDSAAHTVTSGVSYPSGEFDSGLFMPNGDWSHTFSSNGIFPYFCMVHPWMTGEVWVMELEKPTTEKIPTPIPTPAPSSSQTSSIYWQSRYMNVLSDFNDVSAKVGELEQKNEKLALQSATYRLENEELQKQIIEKDNAIEKLNALIQEQVKVIYKWVLGK